MGEVPEHLLKRSAQRRAQLSGDGGAADAPALTFNGRRGSPSARSSSGSPCPP